MHVKVSTNNQFVDAIFLSFLRLLNLLEVITPFKHFKKLREFVQMKLPAGFPVKIGLSFYILSFFFLVLSFRIFFNSECFYGMQLNITRALRIINNIH